MGEGADDELAWTRVVHEANKWVPTADEKKRGDFDYSSYAGYRDETEWSDEFDWETPIPAFSKETHLGLMNDLMAQMAERDYDPQPALLKYEDELWWIARKVYFLNHMEQLIFGSVGNQGYSRGDSSLRTRALGPLIEDVRDFCIKHNIGPRTLEFQFTRVREEVLQPG